MQRAVIDKIEYLILLVSEFASRSNLSEVQAYRYLSQYGALALCEKHYNIMHTLSVDDNMQTLQSYCRRKGGLMECHRLIANQRHIPRIAKEGVGVR